MKKLGVYIGVGAIASTFYLYDFLVRVMPAAMHNELIATLNIHASGLGVLASLFFWGYAIMQIPAGYICDRFSPRYLLSGMLLLCALATAFFGLTSNFYLAGFWRFVIGFTSSFAYIGALRIGVNWYPSKRFALYTGLVQILGCAGAIIGSGPIAALTSVLGWQRTSFVIALVGLVLAALNWLVLRDEPPKELAPDHRVEKTKEEIHLREVFMNPQQWWAIFFGFSIWAPVEIFASLWGVPFLSQVYNFSNVRAASMMTALWIGIAAGGPISGWVSNHVERRKLPMATAGLLGIVCSSLIIYSASLPEWGLSLCLFGFGFASGNMVLAFGFANDINHKNNIGTAVGFTNMAVVFGGVLLQPAVGFIIQHLWRGTMVGDSPMYSIGMYQVGLSLIPISYLLAFTVAAFLLKETHCRARY